MGKIGLKEPFQCSIQDVNDMNTWLVWEVIVLINTIQEEKDLLRVKTLLSDFGNRLSQHFRLEESYLRHQLDSLHYFDHQQQHLFFEDFLRNLPLENSGVNPLDTKELADFLENWTVFHIKYLHKDALCLSA